VHSGRDLDALRSHATLVESTPYGTGEYVRIRTRTSDPDAVFGIIVGVLDARQIDVKDAGLEAVFRRLTGHDFTEADADVNGAAV
jgi:ABC-2 type transport system ATP-binding protein